MSTDSCGTTDPTSSHLWLLSPVKRPNGHGVQISKRGSGKSATQLPVKSFWNTLTFQSPLTSTLMHQIISWALSLSKTTGLLYSILGNWILHNATTQQWRKNFFLLLKLCSIIVTSSLEVIAAHKNIGFHHVRRWQAKLEEINYSFSYFPSKDKTIADMLSCYLMTSVDTSTYEEITTLQDSSFPVTTFNIKQSQDSLPDLHNKLSKSELYSTIQREGIDRHHLPKR